MGYKLVRWIGEAVVPEKELEEIVKFINDILSKCVIATECDLGEGRVDRVVLVKTFYEVVMKFYKQYNNYIVYIDFKSRRAVIAAQAAIVEVIE